MKRSFFLASILSALFICAPVKTQADAPVLQEMIYEVYAGGIHAVQARLHVDVLQAKRYRLDLSAKTRGFLGSLIPWEGTFETNGWILKEETPQPEIHQSIAIWDDETEIKRYSYGKDGGFEGFLVTENNEDKSPAPPAAELTQGTIDALTATLQVMQGISAGAPCEGASDVFDGKRRFQLVFKHIEEVELKSSRYNIYEGPASKCEVEVVPVSGAWHKKPRGWLNIQEQGRERGSLPTIWMAKISDHGPAVPVKVRVKTEWGAMFAHLSAYKNGEKSIGVDTEEEE